MGLNPKESNDDRVAGPVLDLLEEYVNKEGVVGVGEIGLVPTAPAVAGALHAIDGRWRTILPLKNDTAPSE
jgi:CO/xanthine dehydrogenase Mo-binding subunit